MKKHFILLIIMIAVLVQPGRSEPPRLTATGEDFVTASGKTVVLRGINWAEPWTCSREDMVEVRQWGVNVVRLWCHEIDILKEFGNEPGKPAFRIAQVAEWARSNDIYLILVLGDMKDVPSNQMKPWANPHIHGRFRQAWKLVAEATWSNPAVLGYEITNEPTMGSFERNDYAAFANDLAVMLRSISKYTTVVIPGPTQLQQWHPQHLKMNVSNVAYSYTFWDPHSFTHAFPAPLPWPSASGHNKVWLEDRMEILAEASSELEAPLIISEFGASHYATGPSEFRWVRDVMDLMEEKKFHGIYWSYKSYRAKSFHLYYNRVDRAIPTQPELWNDMLSVLKPWWKLNKTALPTGDNPVILKSY